MKQSDRRHQGHLRRSGPGCKQPQTAVCYCCACVFSSSFLPVQNVHCAFNLKQKRTSLRIFLDFLSNLSRFQTLTSLSKNPSQKLWTQGKIGWKPVTGSTPTFSFPGLADSSQWVDDEGNTPVILPSQTHSFGLHTSCDTKKQKKKKRADKESDRKQRVTEFNKVQQGRKDCTSGEKQLAFTTSADFNAFTPPPPSPPFYQRLHSSADSPKGEHRRRRSFPRFLFECWPRTATICANVHEALRHLPAVNIRPGSRSLADNSQLPNWLRLFSFGGYKCSFARR